ncbi:hypothetical protein [Bradyrhizobium sp. RT3a]|uniref:hypothetical protein n=1 Tax=unclassified Bradyrhizobium TaxID=2631580 RepID=UPI0033985593
MSAETVLPVYVVGDSHSLPYRNMIFREKWTNSWVSVHAKYISGLTAYDLFNGETGEFHPGLIQFLEYEGLVRDGQAVHLSMDEIDFSIAKASGESVKPPLILFTVGDIDIRAAIMPALREHDFVPPFETSIPLMDRPLLPWDELDELIKRRVAPLIQTLEEMRRAGFNRLYVQGIVPPTRDEKRIVELSGHEYPVSIRTKLVLAFNRHLATECKRINVKLLDLWPQLTEGEYLRPDLELDGVHVPPRAARWFVEALLEDAINCQWFAVNHARYELYYRMACGLDPFQAVS